MEYKVESTELTDIADAIREKSGSEDALTFPNEFISGIRSIPTGSTSVIADEYDATSTYAVGDYVVYDNTLYKCNTAITTAEAWTSAHWDEVTAMEEVEGKADTDGMYEDMSVGNLISTQFVENKEPYLFRRTGNGKNIDGSEKAFIDKIIGGTVAWNQLAYDNRNATLVRSTQRTINISTNNMPSVENHVYLATARITNTTCVGGFAFQYGGTNWFNAGTGQKSLMYKANNNPLNYCYTYISSDEASDATLSYEDFSIIDLTRAFGSAEIADYVYSLEQTTVGAGVAWLKSHFPKVFDTYHAYNEGSLLSVKTSEHRTVGFNQFDRNTAVDGYIDVDGTPMANTNRSYSDYISVFPNTEYYATNIRGSSDGSRCIIYYDAEKQFIGYGAYGSSQTYTGLFTIPNGAHYMRVNFITAYKDSICINISDPSKNGQYEPYNAHTYPLDSDLELRGLFKLDANNNLYANGDVYPPSGEVSRRYTIVDLGTLNWSMAGSYDNLFKATIPDIKHWGSNYEVPNIICEKYVATKYISLNVNDNTTIGMSMLANESGVRIKDPSYNNPSTFKTAMSGTYLVFEKAQSSTEQADPFASPQVVNPLGTEEYIDTRDVPVPVGHETRYMANLREKIEDLPRDLSMIAPIENGTTASKAYSTGQYFLKDNQFCKALTSIASGATFTLNTNYAVTTVANELYTALHS